MTREQLKERVRKLPMQPGVYMHKDKTGKVIYVGKAKLLKNRVSNYFQPPERLNAKTRQLVSHIDDFDIIVTDSEFEALILESSLIKQHQPKYNILLKDDKGYSYIKVTAGDWPRISETKQVLNDGAKYIGPYLSAWTIKDTVEEARKIFRLPSCTRKFPQEIGRGRPCLNAHIGKSQFPPEFVPEQIEVAEGLAQSMAGEQPRIAWLARNGANDRYGFVGQRDMARPAGFGQRHGKQPLIQTDVFPAGLEDFVLARAGQQKQADGKGFRPVAFFQRPHESLCLVLREIAFPLCVDFEGRDARTR